MTEAVRAGVTFQTPSALLCALKVGRSDPCGCLVPFCIETGGPVFVVSTSSISLDGATTPGGGTMVGGLDFLCNTSEGVSLRG